MLFKILRGNSSRIGTETTPFNDGYMYYTSDDGGLYVDCSNNGAQKRTRVNPSMKDSALLGYAARADASVETLEEYTLSLNESIDNFAMLYIALARDDYVVGSSLIPVAQFKSKLPNVPSQTKYELNLINDQGNMFGGNAEYVTSTQIKGKLVGRAERLIFYGIGRIS